MTILNQFPNYKLVFQLVQGSSSTRIEQNMIFVPFYYIYSNTRSLISSITVEYENKNYRSPLLNNKSKTYFAKIKLPYRNM